MKIVIIGGGIGGLAAALACAQSGHQVLVLERQNVFTEIGAGIQLAPNAFHALDHLGVGDQVRELAVKIEALCLMDGVTGELITQLPLDEHYRQRFANPYAVVHRTDLYYPLLEACNGSSQIELRTSSAVIGYSQDEHGVTVHISHDQSITADVAIGADGIRSVIRQQLVADGPPRVSGHTIYRAIIPMESVPLALRRNSVNLWAGPKWHFVHYPIARGEYMNMAITKDDHATLVVSGEDTPTTQVLAEFPQLNEQALELLKLGEGWKKWVLCDREPVDIWTDGRVALLGDAAHPMLQYAAQGACMALEDAVVLGVVLAGISRHDAAARLKEYNAIRRDRTAQIVKMARKMGEQIYHASGDTAEARNLLLGSLSLPDIHHKLSWLHDMRPPFFVNHTDPSVATSQ